MREDKLPPGQPSRSVGRARVCRDPGNGSRAGPGGWDGCVLCVIKGGRRSRGCVGPEGGLPGVCAGSGREDRSLCPGWSVLGALEAQQYPVQR